MPINLLDPTSSWDKLDAALRVLMAICYEVRVCARNGGDSWDETPGVDIRSAEWDVENGFIVTDNKGRKFRIRMTAEEIKE